MSNINKNSRPRSRSRRDYRLQLKTASIFVVVIAIVLGLLSGTTSIESKSSSTLASTLLRQPGRLIQSIVNKSGSILRTPQKGGLLTTADGEGDTKVKAKIRTKSNTKMATTSDESGNGNEVNGNANAAAKNSAKKTPVYFVSHGGPTTMFQTEHPVYAKLQSLGKEITQQVRPAAIVVFSAHWQSDLVGGIEVNTSEHEPLLYDFYGFPRHYYQEKFPNRGSTKVAERVLELLKTAGIPARGTDRGLDHGVFVPFKVMFDPDTNPVSVPIVQVSLFDDDSATTTAALHMKLGQAVAQLREENILIVVSGMAVHNLRDFRLSLGSGTTKTMPYAVTFDDALKTAMETTPGPKREEAMTALLTRSDARLAHPTFEHLLPAHVGVGAAAHDVGSQIWTLPEGSMSWAQYRFGSLP